jgi:cold shock protein
VLNWRRQKPLFDWLAPDNLSHLVRRHIPTQQICIGIGNSQLYGANTWMLETHNLARNPGRILQRIVHNPKIAITLQAIQPQGGGKDVSVHISAVERAGLSGLNEGQAIEYEEVSDRGKTSAGNPKVRR